MPACLDNSCAIQLEVPKILKLFSFFFYIIILFLSTLYLYSIIIIANLGIRKMSIIFFLKYTSNYFIDRYKCTIIKLLLILKFALRVVLSLFSPTIFNILIMQIKYNQIVNIVFLKKVFCFYCNYICNLNLEKIIVELIKKKCPMFLPDLYQMGLILEP